MKGTLIIWLLVLLMASGCSKKGPGYRAVKPKYHHSWYKNHVHKKKWHIGRMRLHFEKQGVKEVRMK